MDEALRRLLQQFDETSLLIGLFAAVFLLVFLLLRVLARQQPSSNRKGESEPSKVIPVRNWQTRWRWKRYRRGKGRHAPNPLWLVFLAVGLMVAFRSDIWWELKTPGELTGRVTHVRDGDTIEVSGRAIRLNGLTCDERNTPLGDMATAAMMRLVSGKSVRCELNGDRTYDREVGRCSLTNGLDLGEIMISLRLCGRCARYDPLRKYASVQREAGPFQGAMPGYCLALW